MLEFYIKEASDLLDGFLSVTRIQGLLALKDLLQNKINDSPQLEEFAETQRSPETNITRICLEKCILRQSRIDQYFHGLCDVTIEERQLGLIVVDGACIRNESNREYFLYDANIRRIFELLNSPHTRIQIAAIDLLLSCTLYSVLIQQKLSQEGYISHIVKHSTIGTDDFRTRCALFLGLVSYYGDDSICMQLKLALGDSHFSDLRNQMGQVLSKSDSLPKDLDDLCRNVIHSIDYFHAHD
eukprot:TRINITY_DN19486_c0_g1::TRINITY_DN19486_c0_g1_i1::g.17179::m.17179 TRINITY_DN19486_c0_g1::TRINITY_DN19486_c0_g1_i1::g.17179  ORF type:complete len:241 (-),score=1.58,CDC14/PF08045.6/0.00017 TRINITY_DN19486_c0_g1_i1:159-881(-)